MVTHTAKSSQSFQKEQIPCLWTAYLKIKREVEALRKENEVLRRREIAQGIVELAALSKQLQAYHRTRCYSPIKISAVDRVCGFWS